MSLFKYKMIVAYDGTKYAGWQIQPNALSIQEVLQNKLKIVLQEDTQVLGAGRTDAGVHAIGQTAHFTHSKEIDLFGLLASINGLLPKDIRVKSLSPVPLSFNARHDAYNKIYHYHLNLGFVQNPFKRSYSWHIPMKLDLSLMKECASLFLGTHDFTSFANESHAGSAAKNPVRTLKRLDLVEQEDGVRLEFESESFLYKMVRNLTGCLVEVARGKRAISEIPNIIAAKDRRKADPAAPPQGLFLMRVDYP